MNVRLATKQDDSALRQLVRSMPMPGWVRLAYEREPSFFADAAIPGCQTQIIVTENDEKLTGVGGRTLSHAALEGQCHRVGYLHSLRLVSDVRRGTTLARGYRFLGELHKNDPVDIYLTTILESNTAARELLTAGRAGLPAYHDFGRYASAGLAVPTTPRIPKGDWLPPASHRILDFLHTVGPSRQFFPTLPPSPPESGLFPGLSWDSFRVLAGKDGDIRGVAGRWNRSSTRQLRVAGYAPWLRRTRPLLNLFLKVGGYPSLIPSGECLRMEYVSVLCMRDPGDVAGARLIVRGLLADAAGAGNQFLVAGFHEQDPLCAALHGLRGLSYPSRLYVVAYEDGGQTVDQLRCSQRIPYLEIGAL